MTLDALIKKLTTLKKSGYGSLEVRMTMTVEDGESWMGEGFVRDAKVATEEKDPCPTCKRSHDKTQFIRLEE